MSDLCPKCGTDHDGGIPGSLDAELACVEAQIYELTGDTRESLLLRTYINATRDNAVEALCMNIPDPDPEETA